MTTTHCQPSSNAKDNVGGYKSLGSILCGPWCYVPNLMPAYQAVVWIFHSINSSPTYWLTLPICLCINRWLCVQGMAVLPNLQLHYIYFMCSNLQFNIWKHMSNVLSAEPAWSKPTNPSFRLSSRHGPNQCWRSMWRGQHASTDPRSQTSAWTGMELALLPKIEIWWYCCLNIFKHQHGWKR